MSDYDVILFGPTGVTGREVARHLAARAPELGLTWAAAGRDEARMRSSLDAVGAEPDGLLLADATDQSSIDAMAESATTIANLVGPYARYAGGVHAACARAGTHQLDLTGELGWVSDMIERHDDTATDSGAKIVPTAGFESIPFDLATLLAAHTLFERTGDPVVAAEAAVSVAAPRDVTGVAEAVSGGTFTSLVGVLRAGAGTSLSDPYLLDTPGSGTSGRYDLRPRRHVRTGQWLAPMMPAPFLNPPVVHRSAALLRDSEDPIFGADFRYREGMIAVPDAPTPVNGLAATVMAAMAAATAWLGTAPDGVRLRVADTLERVGPSAGDGPSPERLDDWSYRVDVRAWDARGSYQDVVLHADGHPGYKSTARMVGEAALALADPEADTPDGAGYLTPATALGLTSIDRFEHAGVRIATS